MKIKALVIATVTAIFVLAPLMVLPASAYPRMVAAGNVVVSEAQDYATQSFSDPWDMSNSQDMSRKVIRFSKVNMRNGLWSGKTQSNDSYFWFLWGGYPGAYITSRDGASRPIVASFYRRLSFRMYIGAGTSYKRGTFYWFTRKDLKRPKSMLFKVYPGWHTYSLDLPSRFSGRPISLRLDPINRANTTVRIDWIRLTSRPGASVNLQWVDNRSGHSTIYMDNDSAGYDGSAVATVASTSGLNSKNISLDGLQPGNYYFYLRNSAGSLSGYSGTSATVNKAPMVRIVDPDEAGGADWARSALRNPWDMRSPKDISKTFNIVRTSFRRAIFTGVNSRSGGGGLRKNDPYFMLNQGKKAINSNRFHRLTFHYRYGGGFSLSRGTMSRFGWTTRRQDSPKHWQMSDDIVTYKGWNKITIDLKKIRLNRGNYGWRNWITRFRFDPHEDRLSRRFYVNYITLREDDRLRSSFVIRYNLTDTNSGNVGVTIFRDKDRRFGNGNETAIKAMNVAPGRKAYRWRPSRKVRGTYWIYIRANDGINTTGFYSSGPLRVH